MISVRLQKIASYIEDDHDVADIGSDHGLLLVLLYKRGFSHKVLGVENKIGPYSNLENTVRNINNVNFQCMLSNGLNNVSKNFKTIVIAGMGYSNIKEIVLNDRKSLINRECFVIDCHTNQNLVRKFFYKIGYKIEKEDIIYEDSIYYDVIKFVKNNDKTIYDDLELEFGPINLKSKNSLFKQKYSNVLRKLQSIAAQLPVCDKKDEILDQIKILEGVLYEN